MTAPAPEEARSSDGFQHPRNPWYGFLYAGILFVGAAAGAVLFVLGWREAIEFEMTGRTEGLVLVAPGLTAAGAVLVLVRAVLAVGPWLRHRSATPRDARLLALAHDRSNSIQPIVMAFFFGVTAFAGFVLLAFVARPVGMFGRAFLVQFSALLLFVALLCLKAGIQAIWANRFLTERGIPIAPSSARPAGAGRYGALTLRYRVEIRQTHDAHGRPDPRTFVHDLPERALAESALQDVYRFLRELEPTRTATPGEYTYRDPARGQGTLVVLGLGPDDLPRVEERVQIHELERAIGMRDPYLWDRHSPGARRTWRNPWVATILAGVMALAGVITFGVSLALHGEPGRDPVATWVGGAVGFVIAALGVALGLFNLRRVQWWTRARAAVRAAGQPMPSDLSGWE